MFARANRLRLACEFDRAAAVYESIAAEFPEEAEASWGIVLCRYGIEYVDDPATGKKIPTCHRSSFSSVLKDADYQQTLDNADPLARKLYHREAAYIEELREGILSASASEQPYDIFICYKETDERGGRTLDSVLAQNLYDLLTIKGYRVFFSRISLEDKLGLEYEPYIFAALNSAKVMLAVGTCFEHYDAVWVKNEWSRFLKLMEQDSEKHLIPCYKDIVAYDMPKEFRKLQAQDLDKVGAHQDLVRGVEKLLPRSKVSGDAESLLKRTFLFLEDGRWSSADEYCEKVLDIDPGCAEAYLGKLMAELRVNKRDALRDCAEPFDNSYNYKKAARFGDSKLREFLEGCTQYITERNEREKIAREKREEEAHRRDAEELISHIKKLAPLRKKLQGVQGLIAAADHTVGVKTDGTVLTVGDNFYKQCNTFMWSDIVAVSAGRSHTIGLKADGTVVAAGNNYDGACNVSDWMGIVAISAGARHTVGLRADGTVVAVGNQDDHKCDVSQWTNIVAITAGESHTVGLKADGTVVAIGSNIFSKCNVSEWTDIVAISASDDRTVGLKSNGTVVSTSDIMDISHWREIVAISASHFHTVGLKLDGSVVAVGNQDNGQCNVSEWTDIVAISAGGHHTVGLKSDGTLVATAYTGNYYDGQCDVDGWRLFEDTDTFLEQKKKREEEKALTLKKLASQREKLQRVRGLISASLHTAVLRLDGTVVVTGNSDDCECRTEHWSDIVAVSANYRHTVGLKADGTVVATEDPWSGDNCGQCHVSGWQDVIDISTGCWHTVGLKKDGNVVAVGKSSSGQCDVSEWKDIVAISANWEQTIGLKADGTVVAVGSNHYGQCEVSGWKNIVAISAGHGHTVGLKADGTVVATKYKGYTSYDYHGQCDVSDWKDIVAISAGEDHTVGLKADGTVIATKYIIRSNQDEYHGQCDVFEWTDIVAISAGRWHTVGLKADGTIVASKYYGSCNYGQCGVDGWRLFQSIDTFEKDKATALKKREEEKALVLKRQEEEKVLALKKQAEAQERLRRRTAGLCLHCGGTFKGFFTKKCSSCGKEKDY